jgi:hypothetical protein
MRIGAPDSMTSTTQAVMKMTVSPRLGWRISSKATTPVSTAVSGTTGSARSLSLNDSSQAMADDEQRLQEFRRLELGEADAEPAPRAVHLDADDRHQEQRTVKRTAPRIDSRRAVDLGSIETAIITGTASRIQISWR